MEAQDIKGILNSNEYINANELIRIINRIRKIKKQKAKDLLAYWQIQKTKKFIKLLSEHLNIKESDLYYTSVGKYGGTFVHPYIAMNILIWAYDLAEVKLFEAISK